MDKSKEEIWIENGLNPDNYSKAVSHAMDDIAKQEAMAFANWLQYQEIGNRSTEKLFKDFKIECFPRTSNCNIPHVRLSLLSDIRDEMDADMEDSGMAQGEIESCLTHWGNKYVISRREWFSNDR